MNVTSVQKGQYKFMGYSKLVSPDKESIDASINGINTTVTNASFDDLKDWRPDQSIPLPSKFSYVVQSYQETTFSGPEPRVKRSIFAIKIISGELPIFKHVVQFDQ